MSPAKESAAEIAEDYISFMEDRFMHRGCSLRKMSYKQWAAKEIIRRLRSDKEKPPLAIIEQFADIMRDYSTSGGTAGYIFSCACEAAI